MGNMGEEIMQLKNKLKYILPAIIFTAFITYYLTDINNPLKITEKNLQFPTLQVTEIETDEEVELPKTDKLYIVKFFAPECKPCKRDQKFLKKLKQKYPNLNLKGIAIKGTPNQIKQFDKSYGEIFNKLYIDDNSQGNSKLGITNVPQVYIIYKNRILTSYNGALQSEKKKKKIERIFETYF